MEVSESKYGEGKIIEKLELEDICFVRALSDPETQFKNVDGKLITQTTIDKTRGEIPRITQHFTVNHLVTPHIAGNWDTSKAILICPGLETIKLNGNPENLHAVDTFWSHDMIVPKGSVIIWLDNPPKGLVKPDGIEEIIVEKNKINSTNIKYDSLQDYLSTTVNNKLTEMNYPVFWGDNGIYMHQPGIDNSLWDLSKKLGIKSSNPHVYTSFGSLEMGDVTFSRQPLNNLGTFTDAELLKTNEKTGETTFEEILNRAILAIDNFTEPLSDGEQKQLKVFAAELYHRLANNSVFLDNAHIRACVLDFCDKSKSVKEDLTNWSRVDKSKNAQKIISLINPFPISSEELSLPGGYENHRELIYHLYDEYKDGSGYDVLNLNYHPDDKSIDLGCLISGKKIIFPIDFRESISLSGLVTTEKLILPEIVGKSINLSSLLSVGGLILPKIIGGDLYLTGLNTIDGFFPPEQVGGSIVLPADLLDEARRKYPQITNFKTI